MKVNHCPLIKESLQLVQVLTAMPVFPVNHRDQDSPVPCCARSGHDVRQNFFVVFLLLTFGGNHTPVQATVQHKVLSVSRSHRSLSVPITGSVEGESRDMCRSDASMGVSRSGFSVHGLPGIFLLLAGDFAIEAGECNGEGLNGAQRVVEVQGENVVSYPSKLHHNVVHWERDCCVTTNRQTDRQTNIK